MKLFANILLLTTLCSSAFAETIRTSQDGVDVQTTLSPTSFTVGDIVELRIEATAAEGTTLSIEDDGGFGSFTVVVSDGADEGLVELEEVVLTHFLGLRRLWQALPFVLLLYMS